MGLISGAPAAPSLKLVVNRAVVTAAPPALEFEGVAFVPIKAFARDNPSLEIVVSHTGSPWVRATRGKNEVQFRFDRDADKIIVNGETRLLANRARIDHENGYVPKAVLEALNLVVRGPQDQTVEVIDPMLPPLIVALPHRYIGAGSQKDREAADKELIDMLANRSLKAVEKAAWKRACAQVLEIPDDITDPRVNGRPTLAEYVRIGRMLNAEFVVHGTITWTTRKEPGSNRTLSTLENDLRIVDVNAGAWAIKPGVVRVVDVPVKGEPWVRIMRVSYDSWIGEVERLLKAGSFYRRQ